MRIKSNKLLNYLMGLIFFSGGMYQIITKNYEALAVILISFFAMLCWITAKDQKTDKVVRVGNWLIGFIFFGGGLFQVITKNYQDVNLVFLTVFASAYWLTKASNKYDNKEGH